MPGCWPRGVGISGSPWIGPDPSFSWVTVGGGNDQFGSVHEEVLGVGRGTGKAWLRQ